MDGKGMRWILGVLVAGGMAAWLLPGCLGLWSRFTLDEERHNQIDCVFEEDASAYIVYEGQRYISAEETAFFQSYTYSFGEIGYGSGEDDVLLSWNGPRFFYIDWYHSYTAENPIYIYESRLDKVYFCEEYDLMSEIFLIGDTVAEIFWEDMFYSEQRSFTFVNPIEVAVCAKQCPRMEACLELVCVEEQWYVSLPDSQRVWTAADELVKILSENALI